MQTLEETLGKLLSAAGRKVIVGSRMGKSNNQGKEVFDGLSQLEGWFLSELAHY